MIVSQVNNINFHGGNINLKNINPKNICSYDSIKKMAEDKDINILISQYSRHNRDLEEDIYTVIASENSNNKTYKDKIHKGAAIAIISKKASIEEISVRVYNAVMKALDYLEKRNL